MRYLVNNAVINCEDGTSTFGYLGQLVPNTFVDVRDAMQIKFGKLDKLDLSDLHSSILKAVRNAIRFNTKFYYNWFGNYNDNTAGHHWMDEALYLHVGDGNDFVDFGGVASYQHAIVIVRICNMRDFDRSEFQCEDSSDGQFIIVEGDEYELRTFLKNLKNDYFAIIPLPTYLGTWAEDSDISKWFRAYYSSRISIFQTLLNAYIGFMMNDLGFVCVGDTSNETIGLPKNFVSIMKKRNHRIFLSTHAYEYIITENTLLSFTIGRYTSDEFGNKEIK